MKRIVRSAIVEHPAAQMYALVDDIESYPQFLPWCVAAAVHHRTPHSVRATLTAGMRGVRQSFTTQNANHPGHGIDMRLVHGPFKRFAAGWRFKALSPDACKIEFTLEYELSGPFARMLGRLFDQIADTMVDAFSRRADEIHGG